MPSNKQSKTSKAQIDQDTKEILKAVLPTLKTLTALLEARLVEEKPIEPQEDAIDKP